LLNLNANSQSGCPNFDKYFNYIYNQENLDIEYLSAGGYITFGGQANDSLSTVLHYSFIHRLDANGDTIWTRTTGGDDPTNFYSKFGLFPGVWFRQGSLLQDSIIIACGSYQDSTCQEYYHYYGNIVRYNLQGDTVWTRKLALPDTSVGMYGMMVYDDSTFIISGDYRPLYGISNPLYYQKMMVCKYSINGNLIWRKYLPKLTQGSGYKITKAINGDILFCGNMVKFGEFDPALARLNPNGSIIWADSSGSPYYDYYVKAISSKDNGVITIGPKSQNLNNDRKGFNVKKFDSFGNLKWDKIISDFYIGGLSDGFELQDGSLILTGGNGDSINQNIMGYLVRLDSNGDSLWTRNFGSSTTFQLFQSIAQTCDGYVMAGISYQPTSLSYLSRSFGWVVHTDTLGFVTTGIEDVQVQLSLANVSLPYPNPASYQTKIKTFVPTIPSNKITAEENSYLFVFNLQGKQIAQIPVPTGEQETNIDVSTYPLGNYFVVLSVNGYKAATQKLMVVR
jgi:hypothetical protein